jgi:hypothetical protein
VPVGVILLAGKFTSLSFVGLRVGYSEHTKSLTCYAISLMIFGALAAVTFITVLVFSMQFEQEFDSICASKLGQVSSSALSSLGCHNKYIESVNGKFQCSAPVETWEYSTPGLACLNYDCCSTLVEHAVNRFNYMAILSACIVLFCVISLINAGFLYQKVTKFSRSPINRYDLKIFALMVLTVVLGAASACFFYFATPKLTK